MFSGGSSPFDVCNGLKGRDLAFCRESVEKCKIKVPGADADYPYRLDTCHSGQRFVFSRVDWCVESVPKIIEDSGSCPSPSAVNKMDFQSAEDTGECDKYTKKKKEYCLEQINRCLENRDQFTSDNPILPQVCGEPYFTFTNLFFCFEGAHSLIRQYSGCPKEKKEPPAAPAPAAPPPVPVAPAPAVAPVPSGPALKKEIVVLTPSNLASEISGTMHVVVVHSLEGKEIIEDLNGLRPPVEDDAGGFPTKGRIGVIDYSVSAGRSAAKKLGVSCPPPDIRYSKWRVKKTDDPVQKKGKWFSVPYSEPVILKKGGDSDRYLGRSTENVLLIVGANAGPGARESAELRKYLVGAHARGELQLNGKRIDRIALVSNEDVPAVFGDASSALAELSSLPQAFLFSSDYGRRPRLISPKDFPGDITPRAIPRDPSGAGIGLAKHIKVLTPDNIVSVFKDRPRIDLVIVHSLDEEEVVNYLNAIDKHAKSSPLDDILPPESDPVAVINLSNPEASNVASLLGVDLPPPGVKYSRFNLAGRLRPDNHFEGSRRLREVESLKDGDLIRFYGQRPDGWGFVYVNGGNFAGHFKKDSREAVVVVGDPAKGEAAKIAERIVNERAALELKSRYIWINPSGAGAGEALKKLSIRRDKEEEGFGVYRVRSAVRSLRAIPYAPVAEIANDADVAQLLGKTSGPALVIIGQQSGVGMEETQKLISAVMKANRTDRLKISGKKVDRVVVIRDFSRVSESLLGLDLGLGLNLVEQVVAGTRRVQAYILSNEDGERKYKSVSLNLLPGGIKPKDVDVSGDVFSPPKEIKKYAVIDPGKADDMARLGAIESGVLMIAVGADPENQLAALSDAVSRGGINAPIYGIKTPGGFIASGAALLFRDERGNTLKTNKSYTCQRLEKDVSWACVEY